MGHDHAHATGRAEDRRRLLWVLGITLLVAVVEVVGALISGSLALLADAGHMITDASGVGLALAASLVATRPATSRRTFGYHRAEILAALANAMVLLVICGFIAVNGVRRLWAPTEVAAGQMLLFAAIGLAANAVSMLVLRARREESLNMKGAYLEVFADLLGSVGAVLAAVVILATGWTRADAIVSLLIAAMILPRSLTLLREAVGVLLESTPPGLDLDEVRRHLVAADGVVAVHDLHAWSITTGMPALSAHVVVRPEALADQGRLLDRLEGCVAEHFDIEHVTLQIEPETHRAHEVGAEHD